MHPILYDTQQNILSLLQQEQLKLSTRQIALQYHITNTIVCRIRKKYLPDLNLLIGGRPEKLSP